MAADTNTQTEITTHQRSYDRFISMMKWGGAISLLIALLWIIFIGQ